MVSTVQPDVGSISQRLPRVGGSWALAAGFSAIPILLFIWSRIFPSAVERFYSRGIFPYIGRAVGFISGLVPFSIAELGIVCILALVPMFAFWYVRRIRRQDTRWNRQLAAFVRKGLIGFSILAIAFQFVWGLNYARPPLAETLNFDESPVENAELASIAREIVEKVNSSYRDQRVAGTVAAPATRNQDSLRQSIEQSYAANRMLPWPAALGGFSRPKPVLFQSLLARFGVAGVYSPFTGEPNYIDSLPEFDLPFTMAHEMAHARGFARENEADFVAYLICTTSSDARLRYSGYLAGLRVLSQLATVDQGSYREIAKLLEDGPKRDLKTRFEFWSAFRGPATVVGNRVNDFYLKANGIKSGIKNYDEVSALIVGYFRNLKRTALEEQKFA